MKWFVDGYNVIRRDADLRGRESESLESGRSALLAAVAAAARRTGDQFTVVFDGARRDAGVGPPTGQVQVMFSRPPESADDVLRALIVKAGAGSVVASSDRAVCDAARRAGAVAVSAEDFVAALRGGAVWEDEEDGDEPTQKRGGNPRRPSREERDARRVLGRLGGRR